MATMVGARGVACESSPVLDDLYALEAEGIEILACGTCLDYLGLTVFRSR